MKHYQVIQGSPEWLRLRMGKPTASEFDRIITPKEWEPTKGKTQRSYAVYLLTELLLDTPLSGVTSAAMDHGHDWEPKARAAYEMMMGVDVVQCGLCVNDEHTYGASPDGFVGDDGSVEIKCPFKPEIHVDYLLNNKSFVQEYWVQTQGQLFVTGRKWTDLISYFSGLPTVRVRVTPHPEFQAKLGVALHGFCAYLSDLVDYSVKNGWLEKRPAATDWIESGAVDMVKARRKTEGDFDLTDEDAERIWRKSQEPLKAETL